MDRGVKRVIKKGIGLNNFKAIALLALALGFSILSASKVFAADNVLQAIQIEGAKDSYKIVLRSDDSAELKKTIQAPNKMILDLKGIRASKSINTIYNNTASVDSVVVEPTGADTVKILIQADNVNNAEVQFDTLKTPLGVLNKTTEQENADQLVLNKPMESYKPVYGTDSEDEEESTGLSSLFAGSTGKSIKRILKHEKISWTIAFGLLSIILLGGIKSIKEKDSQIKIGLSQSLKERELDLYKEMGMNNPIAGAALNQRPNSLSQSKMSLNQPVGMNYGLKAYQNGTKNPYVSSEIQRPRPAAAPKSPYTSPQSISRPASVAAGVQNTIKNPGQMAAAQRAAANPALKQAQTSTQNRSANIDSMKFLESMTKIYEKNGRADLAQGIKLNMKKAKTNAL